jgi:hypothetical protein
MFKVTNSGIEGVYVRRRKRFGWARASKTFGGSQSIPTMGCKEALEIGSTVDLDIGAGLFKVDAVESGGQTKVFKRGVSFTRKFEFGANGSVDGISNRGRRANNGEVIDLLTEKNRLQAKLVRNVNVAFICGVLEVKFRQSEDGVDVVLPEASTFGMALESTPDRDDKGTVKGDTEAMLVPFGKDVIDGKKSRNMGTRGVCICISSVTGEDEVVEGGSKSTEEAEDGSLYTRRV